MCSAQPPGGPSAGSAQALDLVVLEGPEQTGRYWDLTFPDADRRAGVPLAGLVRRPRPGRARRRPRRLRRPLRRGRQGRHRPRRHRCLDRPLLVGRRRSGGGEPAAGGGWTRGSGPACSACSTTRKRCSTPSASPRGAGRSERSPSATPPPTSPAGRRCGPGDPSTRSSTGAAGELDAVCGRCDRQSGVDRPQKRQGAIGGGSGQLGDQVVGGGHRLAAGVGLAHVGPAVLPALPEGRVRCARPTPARRRGR